MVNRLIIIGNGFDLAHGLKTSYNDFISDYFKNLKWKVFSDEFLECYERGNSSIEVRTFNELQESFPKNVSIIFDDTEKAWAIKSSGCFIMVKNRLFHSLSEMHINRWVDIEAEYYRQLLLILDTKGDSDTKNNLVTSLNLEMDAITRRFDNYLKENVVEEVADVVNKRTNDIFNITRIRNDGEIGQFIRQFPAKFGNLILDKYQSFKNRYTQGTPQFTITLILNFNYTRVAEQLYTEDYG